MFGRMKNYSKKKERPSWVSRIGFPLFHGSNRRLKPEEVADYIKEASCC